MSTPSDRADGPRRWPWLLAGASGVLAAVLWWLFVIFIAAIGPCGEDGDLTEADAARWCGDGGDIDRDITIAMAAGLVAWLACAWWGTTRRRRGPFGIGLALLLVAGWVAGHTGPL